ncbi:MAG: hypothetical protein OK457_00695 [Thaumarchaeota archaeon]|nr:hypothetical protein [Nitrososphaerota archaeon]
MEKVYIIVPHRLDTPAGSFHVAAGYAAAQAAHAISLFHEDVSGDTVVVLSVHDSKELVDVQDMLVELEIPFVRYEDELGVIGGKFISAIAVRTFFESQSACLKYLQTWKCACEDESPVAHR